MPGEQARDRDRPAGIFRNLDRHRLAAEHGQDVAIRRVAGPRHPHPFARLEQGKERQEEPRGRAGGDHDPGGIEVEAVRLGIMAGDAGTQRGNAQRLGIGDPRSLECGARRRNGARRRRRRRLADFHVHDAPSLGLEPGRRRHHVHDHERRHIAAGRGRDQPFRRIEHDRDRSDVILAVSPRYCRIPQAFPSIPKS